MQEMFILIRRLEASNEERVRQYTLLTPKPVEDR
jgi:hypothetical protein